MPTILPEDQIDAWLSGEAGKEILVPYPADQMTVWPISQRVNSPQNDDPGMLDPILGGVQMYKQVGQRSDSDVCRMSQCYPGGQWVSEGRAKIWNRCLSFLVPDLAGRGFWFCVEL